MADPPAHLGIWAGIAATRIRLHLFRRSSAGRNRPNHLLYFRNLSADCSLASGTGELQDSHQALAGKVSISAARPGTLRAGYPISTPSSLHTLCSIPNVRGASIESFSRGLAQNLRSSRRCGSTYRRLTAGSRTGTCSTISTLNPSSAGTFVGVLLSSRMR